MSARFLLRFDDICPTMDWTIWNQITPILDRFGVRPLLAVVPDNRDPKLMVAPPNADFWSLVRDWQARGWSIAMHGYQHAYVTKDAGIVGLNPYSEFSGLPYEEQAKKIDSGLSIFAREGIAPDAWIAPAHSFDATTVRVLLERGMRVISDGFYWRKVEKLGAIWIPQQLWQFRSLPAGLWTVCIHANQLSSEKILALANDVERFRHSLVSLADAVKGATPAETMLDRTFARFWSWKVQRRRRR